MFKEYIYGYRPPNPQIPQFRGISCEKYINERAKGSFQTPSSQRIWGLYEVPKMADLLVVKAKLKEVAKGCNVAGDFADELDKKVRKLVDDAVSRAEANGRKTVMAKDL